MTKLSEVFGVSADHVLSYIVRDSIDGLFTSVLKEDKHVVVYGASKCLDSWDHVPMRSWPLFKARQVLRTLFQSDLSLVA